MTVSSHAQVLSSSTGVYVLLISLITCRIVHKFEVIGYVIALFGVIIMLSDPFAMKQAGKTNYLLGNVISLTGAGFAAII
jgi:drug/metabolite transporter (DMT)-like permease